MVRQTSIDAYHRIKAEGLLSKMRLAVYEALYLNGPMTGKELDAALGTDSAHKRLSELKLLGVVSDSSPVTRTCRVSGECVYEWDVTTNLPIKIEPSKVTAARPSTSDLTTAMADIRQLYVVSARLGLKVSPAFLRVAKWLGQGAPD